MRPYESTEGLDGDVERLDRALVAGESDPRLDGRLLPSVRLPFVEDGVLDLVVLAERSPLVICIFGAVERDGPCPADEERLANWTRYESRLGRSGHRLIAISSESFASQARWMPLTPGWMLLSDTDLLLARRLPLPTESDAHSWRYVPATLVTQGTRIVGAFSSVGASDAEVVTTWIDSRKAPRAVPVTVQGSASRGAYERR
jgi:hypothetical protein